MLYSSRMYKYQPGGVKMMEIDFPRVQQLTRQILDELFLALGIPHPGLRRNLLQPFFFKPADRFSRIAIRFDQLVANSGFQAAARWLLSIYVKDTQTRDIQHVPASGPLLVVSNHPGAYDSMVIAASLPRDDLKIVATGVDFLKNLPITANHLIYTDRHNLAARGMVIRNTIRHLQKGGAVLIFPGGSVDPDPEVLPGAEAELNKWSPSLEVILKHAPETQIQPTITSGVIAQSVARNPLINIFKGTRQRRVMVEFIQVMLQTLRMRNFQLRPHVSFGDPIPVASVEGDRLGEAGGCRERILAIVRRLLAEHLDWIKPGHAEV
jgi:1-acyl-sn-glycerol-3-phosphate acyltransferase